MLPKSILVCTVLLLLSKGSAGTVSQCGLQRETDINCLYVVNRQCRCSYDLSPPCQWLCTGPELSPSSIAYGLDTSYAGLDFDSDELTLLEEWAVLAEELLDPD